MKFRAREYLLIVIYFSMPKQKKELKKLIEVITWKLQIYIILYLINIYTYNTNRNS